MSLTATGRVEPFLAAYARRARCVHDAVREAGVLLDAFEAVGIPALPLKGVDLLGRAYGGAMGLRHISDIDLLVREESLGGIARILAGGGYEPFANGNPSFRSARGGHCIDLSTELAVALEPEAVWRRAVRRPIAGRMRAVMHPEDALIHLVAYQTLHRGCLDRRFAQDVAVLLRSEAGNIDWTRVLEEIRALRLALPFHHGLSYARQQGGADVPDGVLTALRDAAGAGWFATIYRKVVCERSARMPKLGILLRIAFRPGPGAKAVELWRTIVPSGPFLAYRYGRRGAPGLLFARLLRPVVLACRGAALLPAWVRHLSGAPRAKG
ncbi:MAG: nucleotidyltransferase family protein [Planctomycetes bacterium]|nr:nucleotidyltransferase family protein [Planctomycetota bacterium]